MAAKRIALFGGLGVAGSYGLYAASAMRDVAAAEREVSELATMIGKERKSSVQTDALIKEHDAKLALLSKQEVSAREELAKALASLEAAQATADKAQQNVTSIDKDAKATTTKLFSLKSERQRIMEALTLGQQSLTLTQGKAAEARALLNPLNSPWLKGAAGKK
mmetsp:Transcript_4498/g.7587  ORF Transcript_4498/g.7587 Transcript_4498/m.7587 type:complete len:164 (+) Transcript_4498:111-602(+)|eukprot:CAMPEP_0119107968 /NCGR_PEP_ID=MMETSP1180-20130426/12652_1 /TAXON_ID=3052 ORGANISM="Chlamydomonas cf sp, Strain CCMP681" /NCGR_SAMPLE_ID=MMETSP1180 /ASSEMBLY_ACC=CAM_ASM_000741 /LENGTH=163 /DNA_ID=CAMNT_0007093521 /DNA_START=109 /DNA_END=600 /DNA_ORIENTATION=+